MMMNKRIYPFKDMDMLMASRTIAEHFGRHLGKLQAHRKNWNEAYSEDLKVRIDSVMNDYLGTDRKKALKETTLKLNAVQKNAISDLIFLKTQIQIDFPEKDVSMLKKLGYNKLTKKVLNGNQELLTEILFIIKRELSDKMKSHICSKGTDPLLIDRIVSYADQIMQLNTIQERWKKSSKMVTDEVKIHFNHIYREISGICKIARIVFKNDPVIKEQFVFSSIVKQLHAD